MISKIEEKNRAELFRLMREFPKLPVVPMIDSEIVASGRYLGAWGAAYIAEYLIGDELVFFRDDDDAEQISIVLAAFFGYDRWLEMNNNGTAAAEYAALPWTRAIIVYVETMI